MKRAPWTAEQVASLNKYQTEAPLHPFTCPNHGDPRDLIATPQGWKCPQNKCHYTQDWAHEFMLTYKGDPLDAIDVMTLFMSGRGPQ